MDHNETKKVSYATIIDLTCSSGSLQFKDSLSAAGSFLSPKSRQRHVDLTETFHIGDEVSCSVVENDVKLKVLAGSLSLWKPNCNAVVLSGEGTVCLLQPNYGYIRHATKHSRAKSIYFGFSALFLPHDGCPVDSDLRKYLSTDDTITFNAVPNDSKAVECAGFEWRAISVRKREINRSPRKSTDISRKSVSAKFRHRSRDKKSISPSSWSRSSSGSSDRDDKYLNKRENDRSNTKKIPRPRSRSTTRSRSRSRSRSKPRPRVDRNRSKKLNRSKRSSSISPRRSQKFKPTAPYRRFDRRSGKSRSPLRARADGDRKQPPKVSSKTHEIPKHRGIYAQKKKVAESDIVVDTVEHNQPKVHLNICSSTSSSNVSSLSDSHSCTDSSDVDDIIYRHKISPARSDSIDLYCTVDKSINEDKLMPSRNDRVANLTRSPIENKRQFFAGNRFFCTDLFSRNCGLLRRFSDECQWNPGPNLVYFDSRSVKSSIGKLDTVELWDCVKILAKKEKNLSETDKNVPKDCVWNATFVTILERFSRSDHSSTEQPTAGRLPKMYLKTEWFKTGAARI